MGETTAANRRRLSSFAFRLSIFDAQPSGELRRRQKGRGRAMGARVRRGRLRWRVPGAPQGPAPGGHERARPHRKPSFGATTTDLRPRRASYACPCPVARPMPRSFTSLLPVTSPPSSFFLCPSARAPSSLFFVFPLLASRCRFTLAGCTRWTFGGPEGVRPALAALCGGHLSLVQAPPVSHVLRFGSASLADLRGSHISSRQRRRRSRSAGPKAKGRRRGRLQCAPSTRDWNVSCYSISYFSASPCHHTHPTVQSIASYVPGAHPHSRTAADPSISTPFRARMAALERGRSEHV